MKLPAVVLSALVAGHAAHAEVRPIDTEPGSPMPAATALKSMKIPEGFTATLFATEPYVRQPIDMKVDARGRVWVAESYSYMNDSSMSEDRIIVLIDKDNNGMADTRKIFKEGFSKLTSIEIGFGGVWVLDPPNLTFYPDADGDLNPDGPPVIHHTNWSTDGSWNSVNGLCFGPDGWLYGRLGQGGASTPRSMKGVSPGRISGGVWRYHPVSGKFQPYAHGMTNPWGLDWNEDGEMFVSGNCNGHLWHIVGGSLYEWGFGGRQFSHEYGRTPAIELVPHYSPGKDWWSSWQVRYEMADANDAYGGGHSHSGLVICNGSAWPEKMRGHTLMSNIHGGRINEDTIESNGSTYISRRVGDAIRPADKWFRGVSLVPAPDGALFISDWSDTGECHDQSGIHQNSGRIYRLQPLARTPVAEIDSLQDPELLELLKGDREEPARQALKILQHRARLKKLSQETPERLAGLLAAPAATVRMRALSALHGGAILDDKLLLRAARDSDENVRAMAVRLWADGKPETTREPFTEMAAKDPSPRVMLHLASVTRLLDPPLAGSISAALLNRTENPPDARTVQLLWHIQIQSLQFTSARAKELVRVCRSEQFARFLASHVVEEEGRDGLSDLFQSAATLENPVPLLSAAIGVAREKMAYMKAPANWPEQKAKWMASPDPALQGLALSASLLFGDRDALLDLKTRVRMSGTPLAEKTEALEILAAVQTPDAVLVVQQSLRDKALRIPAMRALRRIRQSSTAPLLIDNWKTYDEAERHTAVETLVTRREWSLPLLAAIGSGKIEKTMLTATQARDLAESGDAVLKAAVLEHWGNPARSGSQKDEAATRAARLLAKNSSGDPNRGRLLFMNACGSCHTLYGEGGKLGPDLTGRNRADLGSLIRSIVDPSADVPEEGQLTVVTRKDASISSGILLSRNAKAATLRTQEGEVVIPSGDIAEVRTQPVSPMPEGLLDPLSDQQLQDLFSYLRADQAAPRPPQPVTRETR